MPTNQNHDTPSTALRTAGCLLARRRIAQRFGDRIPVDLQVRRAGFGARNGAADEIAGDRQRDDRGRRDHRAVCRRPA